jgi:hypothetical protein
MQHPQDSDLDRTYCYSVRAEAGPSVMPRLLALFAKRGMIPAAMHARCHDQATGALQVDIEACGLDRLLAEYIQRCMRQIVGVELVLLSTKHTLQASQTHPVARAG